MLFGRLRPNLNKVWLARGEVVEGICSTEFLVLRPILERVRPSVLRYLLSSYYIKQHVHRLITGTALPRISITDLLDIEVPLPTLETQEMLEQILLQRFDEMIALKRKLEKMPVEILQDFMKEVEKV